MTANRPRSILSAAAAMAMLAASPLLAADKINYQDHILPIFRNSCLTCHNSDKKKAGLDLSSYSNAMAGSNSGVVINSGDPDGSLLFKVVMHTEEPTMPPKKDKLADKELDQIKAWIAGGALETATGKPAVSTKPKIDLSVGASAIRRPDGPPPMPADFPGEPVVRANRAWAVGCMAVSPWAPVLAIGGQHQIFLYNTDTLELLGVVPFTDGEPTVVQFSRNGKLLLIGGGIAAKSGKVSLWDITTGQKLTDVGDEFDSVLGADLSPDQTCVALGGPTKVLKVYSTRDGALQHVIKKHTDWVTAVAYSTDGVLLASGDRAGGLWVWEAKTGAEFYNLAGHKGAITAIAFRDDSNILASASEDGFIKLWDMPSGKEVKSFNAHPGGALSVAFTHDGRIVSCGRDRVVKVWSADGSALRGFDAFNDIALHATFDSAGKRVVAGDWTGDVRVWDCNSGTLAGKLSVNPAPLADRLGDAEARIAAACKSADAATSALQAAKSNAARLAKELKNAQDALAEAKKALDDDIARRAALVSELKSQSGAVKEAEASLPARRAALAQARQTSGEANKRLEAVKKEMQSLEDVRASRQAEAEHASDAAKSADIAAKAAPDNATLAAVAKDRAADAAKAADALTAAQLAVKQKQDALKSASDAKALAEAQLHDAQLQLDAAIKLLADAHTSTDKLAEQLRETKTDLALRKNQVADAEKRVGPAEGAMKSAAAQANSAKAAADAASTAFAAAHAETAHLKLAQLFMGVYSARQELAARQAQADKSAAAAAAAQTDLDAAAAHAAALRHVIDDGAAQIRQRQDAIAKAREAAAAADRAAGAASEVVQQKQTLLNQANDLKQKLADEIKKAPGDKPLSDAAGHARAAVASLATDVDAAKSGQAAAIEAQKSAASAVATTEKALTDCKAELAATPQKLEAAQAALTAAQADVPQRKSAADAAAKAAAEAKAKVDSLTADYQKKVQAAGPAASATANKS